MDDLERLHRETQEREFKLHEILTNFIRLENVTLRSAKGFAYCTNELLAYIPMNRDLKKLVRETLYNVMLRVSIEEFCKILSDVIQERENDVLPDGDHRLFDVIFRDSGIG